MVSTESNNTKKVLFFDGTEELDGFDIQETNTRQVTERKEKKEDENIFNKLIHSLLFEKQ